MNLSKLFATLLVAFVVAAAGAGSAFARHGADDPAGHHRHEHHGKHHHHKHHHHKHRHGADDGPNHH